MVFNGFKVPLPAKLATGLFSQVGCSINNASRLPLLSCWP